LSFSLPIPFFFNSYKIVKESSLAGSLSGPKEGSKPFARYCNIDQEMKKELIGFLD